MTKEEVLKNYGVSSVIGICELCEYANSCTEILKDFNKPNSCAGPFFNYED